MTAVVGHDGNLAHEFILLERFMRESIEVDSHRPYTCAVAEQPVYQCLDIAAPSTLRGTLVDVRGTTADTYAVATTASQQMNLTEAAVPFGAEQPCDGKRVGDGTISPLDMAVLLFYQFGVPPYDAYPMTPQQVSTIEGATDVGARCAMSLTRGQYMQNYTRDACYLMTSSSSAVGGRRLAGDSDDDDLDLDARLLTWTASERGAWYRIQTRAPYHAVELELRGLVSTGPRGVALSNRRAPSFNQTDDDVADPARVEVRFERHGESQACAAVVPIVSADTVLYKQTLAFAQMPSREQVRCAVDVFVWVPSEERSSSTTEAGCPFVVGTASTAMDGKRGATQRQASACASLHATRAALTASPPPPPQPPPLPPPAVAAPATPTNAVDVPRNGTDAPRGADDAPSRVAVGVAILASAGALGVLASITAATVRSRRTRHAVVSVTATRTNGAPRPRFDRGVTPPPTRTRS